MTNGVGSPLIMVERSSLDTSSAIAQANSVMPNIICASFSLKKAAIKSRKTGSLAPQGMKGAVIRVASFSFGLRSVLVAITPGTAQPPMMPPETMKGMAEQPCRPKTRRARSSM